METNDLTVVVWDDEQQDGEEPWKFYNRTAYLNCLLFHIWRSGESRPRRRGICGHNQLLVLHTGKTVTLDDAVGIRIRSDIRFVSLSHRGEKVTFKLPLDGMLHLNDLLPQIEQALPAARKVLFNMPDHSGWEVYVRKRRNGP